MADAAPALPNAIGARIPPRGLCFRDRPKPVCRVSVVVTAAAYTPIAATDVEDQLGKSKHALTAHSDFALGVLWNASQRNAFGLAVGGGAGLTGHDRDFERNEIHAIYRRWLRNDMAFDFEPGLTRADVRNPAFLIGPVRRTGGTVTMDLHYKHWAIATVRGDLMSGDEPNAKALYVGFKVDGYTAVLASGAAALAYFFAAISDSD
jgi:hypothetical protein